MDDPDQVAVAVKAAAAGEDQTALLFVHGFVARAVRAEVEGDPGLAGYVGALVRRLAHDVSHLPERHADFQLGELALGRGVAGDFAFVVVDALDGAAAARFDQFGVDHIALGVHAGLGATGLLRFRLRGRRCIGAALGGDTSRQRCRCHAGQGHFQVCLHISILDNVMKNFVD